MNEKNSPAVPAGTTPEDVYEAPKVESVVSAADLAREVQYAGTGSQNPNV